MKIVATIEARMTSTRLPGKVLKTASGKPMLEHLVNRLKTVSSVDSIVLATTRNTTDDILEAFAKKKGICCYRGDEDDVLDRVIGAASENKADVIVEITGDCPVIDPQIIEQTIRIFKANRADYVSNVIIRSYPVGMDTQVFPLDILKRSASMTKDRLDHEHVTLHIRNHPKIFSHLHLVSPPELYWPELGLALDEKKDYDLLKKIIENFSTNYLFTCMDIIKLMRAKPDWQTINRDVIRKGNT